MLDLKHNKPKPTIMPIIASANGKDFNFLKPYRKGKKRDEVTHTKYIHCLKGDIIMTKEALTINNASEIERSTLELLFRLYFDKLSCSSVDDKTNDIKIIIANDRSEYWADITRVVNSPMYIREIKKGLVENGLYSQDIFNENEFSRLADYDFFSIAADYKSTREVAKYTLVFKFPNFIDVDSVRIAIRAIQNAISVGLIKEENINDATSILIGNIVFGDYHKNNIL